MEAVEDLFRSEVIKQGGREILIPKEFRADANLLGKGDIIAVRDVNWANPNIYRAGVIPICVENRNKWIGLAA